MGEKVIERREERAKLHAAAIAAQNSHETFVTDKERCEEELEKIEKEIKSYRFTKPPERLLTKREETEDRLHSIMDDIKACRKTMMNNPGPAETTHDAGQQTAPAEKDAPAEEDDASSGGGVPSSVGDNEGNQGKSVLFPTRRIASASDVGVIDPPKADAVQQCISDYNEKKAQLKERRAEVAKINDAKRSELDKSHAATLETLKAQQERIKAEIAHCDSDIQAANQMIAQKEKVLVDWQKQEIEEKAKLNGLLTVLAEKAKQLNTLEKSEIALDIVTSTMWKVKTAFSQSKIFWDAVVELTNECFADISQVESTSRRKRKKLVLEKSACTWAAIHVALQSCSCTVGAGWDKFVKDFNNMPVLGEHEHSAYCAEQARKIMDAQPTIKNKDEPVLEEDENEYCAEQEDIKDDPHMEG